MEKHEYAAVVFKTDNDIEHRHKYVDRKMVKGKWRYTYPDDLKKNNIKGSPYDDFDQRSSKMMEDFEQRRLQMKEDSDKRQNEIMDDYNNRVAEQRKEWESHQKQMDGVRKEFQNLFTEMSNTIDNLKEIKLHDKNMNPVELAKYNINAINENRKAVKKLCSNGMKAMTRIIRAMGPM